MAMLIWKLALLVLAGHAASLRLRKLLGSRAGRRTTAQATKACPSAAQATASITASMYRSSPLAPPITESGPAEQGSECAHEWLGWFLKDNLGKRDVMPQWCQRCGVLTLYGRTHVPAAAPTPSTSQRLASTPSAPVQTSAASSSRPSSEVGY